MGELKHLLLGKMGYYKEHKDEKLKEAALRSARFSRRRSAVKEVSSIKVLKYRFTLTMQPLYESRLQEVITLAVVGVGVAVLERFSTLLNQNKAAKAV